MNVLLVILFCVLQANASSAKWDCAKDCEPPDKNVTRLNGREMLGRIVSCETPKLPNLLDANGTVLVEVFVNAKGDVSCARAISGIQPLQAPALEAAKKWKFKPLLNDGKPKSYTGFIYIYASWDTDEMKKHCPNNDGPNKSLDASREVP